MFKTIIIAPLVRIRLDLSRFLSDARPPSSLECRSLAGVGLEELKRFHEKTGVADSYFEAMVRRKDWGYGCFINGSMVAWIWVQWDAAQKMTLFSMDVPALMSDSSEVYLHHVYTLPENRTWSVWAALTHFVYADLAARGLKAVYGLIQPTNELSLKLHLERGWAATGKYMAIGFSGRQGRLLSVPLWFYRAWLRLKALKPNFARLIAKTWLLEGEEVATREPLRIVLSTRRPVVPLFLKSFFRGEPRLVREGAETERIHFVFWERPWWRPLFLERRFGMAIPHEISLGVSLATHDAAVTARIEAACARLTVKKGWSFSMVQDQDALYRFFYFYLEPSMKKGVPAAQRSISLNELQAQMADGYLLQVADKKKILAMMMVTRIGNILKVTHVGVRGGAKELVRQGVLSAAVAYLVQQNRGQSLRVEFDGLSPFLTKKGVLLFGHWPANFMVASHKPRYWMTPNLCDDLTQRALKSTLVCHLPSHQWGVTFFYSTDNENRVERVKLIKTKSSFLRGDVRAFPFPPVVRRNPAAIAFAKHPVAIWPAVCRMVLSVFRRVRSFTGVTDLDAFYRQSPYWPLKQLQEWQGKKLKQVLSHAASTVPHYKTILNGFTPTQFSMEWFRTIPLMDRQDIARHAEHYISPVIKPGTTISTSGTSGHPLTIHIDMETLRHREAAQRRGRQWWGFSVGDRFAKLFGRISPQRLPRRIRERIFENRVLFNAYAVTPAAMYRWHETLCRKSFSYIYGYASATSELTREWQRRGFFLPAGWIDGVIVTADTIADEQRENIEHVLGAPTIREYGATEFHVIAMECPDGGWHLEADRLFIEFLNIEGKPARPFELARIVVTALDSLRMPLIRYPLADVGSYSDQPCVCGRTLPLLHSLAGRDVSTLRLPTGGLSHSGVFSVLIEAAHKECDRLCPPWQAVQHSQAHLEIVLAEKLPSPEVEETIRRKMKKVDPLFQVTFLYVDSLPVTPGGKRNRFVELVSL